jgi:hypothetical protein
MEVQYSQLKINHLSDTLSTKAAGGGIFSGVFKQRRQGTSQGQEDLELSWYLFFQQHEWKEVSTGELLKLIPEFESILNFESSQFWKRLETSIQDTFNRWASDQGTRVVPALEDLLVDLLYVPVADEDVFQRHSVGERLRPTVVNESDGEV